MNKLNSEIVKSLRQIRDDAAVKIKNLIKQKNVILVDALNWNKPDANDFKMYGADAKLYTESLNDCISTKIGSYEIDNMLIGPTYYEFVAKEEFRNFEKNVYPKLYAKWDAEQKAANAAKRKAAAEDAAKLRRKIAKLQKELDEIEA